MNTNIFKRKTKVINDDDNIEIINETEEIHDEKEKIKTENDEHLNKNNIKKKKITENESKSTIPQKAITEKKSETISINSENKLSQIKSQIKLGNKPKEDHEDKTKEKSKTQMKNGMTKKIEKTGQTVGNKHASKPILQNSKLTNKKRKRDSSDSDSSNSEMSESEDSSYEEIEDEESSSSESSSESEISGSMKKSTKKEKKSSPPKKKIKQDEKFKQKAKQLQTKEKKVLKTKASLVNQLLRRWWYSLPKWPPEGYDPSMGLTERKLRVINRSEWKIEPNVDNKGFTKCVELDGYKYVFVDYLGKFHDLRPNETKPSYSNFLKKTEKELYVLLIKAINNQLNISESELDQSTRNNLKEELKLVESNYKLLFGETYS